VTQAEIEGSLLGRATRVASVFAKYGFRETRGSGDALDVRARRFRDALEELGPTYAKLGQILSTRPDLLPPEFISELSTLQDDVAPLTEAEVVGVMEQELGVPWEDVFESIDPQPLAAGTIGQVHSATLEGGERVVVKVQRPGARDEIMRDLGLLRMFAEKTENREPLRRIVDLPAVVEHLASSLQRELDFEQEATNIDRMREVLESFSRLDAPRVHHRFTTTRLLVLELIPGGPVREAPSGPERKEAAAQLLESFYRQILTDGFFHADPHPGNMLWSDGTIYFLDLGMVGEVTPDLRERVLLLLLAFWQEDVPFLAEILLVLAP
jgi:ubiquinone biosynthesis protein